MALTGILAMTLLIPVTVYADDNDDKYSKYKKYFKKDDDDKHYKYKYYKSGVVEINQWKALKGRVTKSDGKGFPVTLDSSGSYKLTSNLTITDGAVDGIDITADNVTLNLNGFAIIGSASGTGIGISAFGQSNVNVFNGSVLSMGSHGIVLDIASTVDRVNALDNGGDGIVTQGGSRVTNSTASRNFGNGINTGIGCQVENSIANRNGVDGITVGLRSSVLYNTANFNENDGIETAQRCLVVGNAASENERLGLRLDTGTGYRENVLSSNNDENPNSDLRQVRFGIQIGNRSNICGATYCP